MKRLFAVPESLRRSTTEHLRPRQVPEIDGSQGAFIAVVVTLSALIVVCCAAVFYLLRHHEPTEQDRAARRERYRRAREQTLNSNSTLSGWGAGAGSLGDKVKQVWQSTTGRGRGGGGAGGAGGRRAGRGWIRAGSDDELGSRSRSDRGGGNVDPEVGGGGQLKALPLPVSFPVNGPREGGDVGVRVVESPLSDSACGFGGAGQFGYVYTDPFGKTALGGALQRSQSPLSSPSSSPSPSSLLSSPRGSPSVEETRSPPQSVDDRRQRSTMSNGSVWTQAGSKFVEDI